MKIIIILLIGYCLGAIQPAYFIGRLVSKTDIRKEGSMNLGASNVTITFGWKLGMLTAVIDILKAVIPILILKFVFKEPAEFWFVIGLGVILGHVYPFYLGFKGGKGTASFIGMMIAIHPVIGLLLSASIVLITYFTNYIALGTYGIMLMNPILLWVFHFSWQSILVACGISTLSIIKHIPNIQRILNKTEKTLRSTIKKKGCKVQ